MAVRWEEVAGYADELSEQLQAIKAIGVGERVAGPRDRCVRALGKARAMHIALRDEVQAIEGRSAQALRPLIVAAEQAVPNDAGLMANGREPVVKVARDRALNEQRTAWAAEIVAKAVPSLQGIAGEAVAAFQDLDAAVEGERLRFDGPSTLFDPPKDLQAILLEQRLAHELEQGGVDSIESAYLGMLKIGDVERIKAIESASRAFLLRVIEDGARTEERRKSARSTGRTTDGALSKAFALLAEFDRQRKLRVPPEVGNAFKAREALIGLFGELLGISARYLTREAFAARFLDGDGTQVRDPYEVDPGWPKRFLPPAPPPVGWRPIIGYGPGGQRVRDLPMRLQGKGGSR